MARPEGWRLRPATYPVSIQCDTRFQDLDFNNHLNNVAIAGLFENARSRLHFNKQAHADRASGVRPLIAAIEINYLGEGFFPDPVTIASGIGAVGNSSWTIAQAMFQNERCIATADAILANRQDGKSMPLSDALRASLEAMKVRVPT
jgi:acyl-CoA thioester hydrolase